MQIWLDLRFIIEGDFYSNFVKELVKELVEKSQENNFIIYSNTDLRWFDNYSNVSLKNVWITNFSIKEQLLYLKILKKDKNNLMLFFNQFKPIFYKKDYFIIIPSLKDIYYSDFNSSFTKHTFLYLFEKNLINSKKIICFDTNTIDELIEKFNLKEENISILNWFFSNSNDLIKIDDKMNIDIRSKFSIKNDYFIYSAWEWVEKNYEKLIHVFSMLKKEKYKVDLVFIWDDISKNISLRNTIIELSMQDNIHFLWVVKTSEKILFYKNSLWVIYPSFYEPFPFSLTEAVFLDTPIISSELKIVSNIFKDKIVYFSPISINNIFEKLKYFIDNNKTKKVNYSNIRKKYTKKSTLIELLEIIK